MQRSPSLPPSLGLAALLLGALLWWPATSPLAADPAHRPLLRVQETFVYADGTVELLAMVFRDGTAVMFQTNQDGRLSVYRSQASAAEFADLQRVLADNAIGVQPGDCSLSITLLPTRVLPAGVTGRLGLFSWFGVHERRSNHLRISDGTIDGLDGSCKDEVAAVVSAVRFFLIDQFVIPEPVPVDPVPFVVANDQLLYVVRNSLQEDPDCGDGTLVDDTFLFRDGLMVRDAVKSDGEFFLERGQATVPARQEFHQALATYRVGLRAGECKTWFFQPFSVDGACVDYSFQTGGTWYGANKRRATLFGTDASEQACSFEQDQIAAAASQLVRNTGAQPQTQRVSGHLPTF